MKRKTYYLLFIFILLFLFNQKVKADSRTGFVNCQEDNSWLTVRTGPSYANSTSESLSCNTSVVVTDTTAISSGDGNNWYKIKYNNNQEGYVNSKYIAFDYIESEENNKGYVSCVENNDPLTIRPSNDLNEWGVVTTLSCNTEMTILEENTASNSRCSNWMKVQLTDGTIGYACGTYVYKKTNVNMTTNHINEYKDYLRSIGFAESYLDSLVSLHALHPTWNFRAIKTRSDWNYVISQEAVEERSLVWKTFGDGYRSDAYYSYNYATNEYSRHPTETNWWYASNSAIKYYMDPRNFLTEGNIFMFESLLYQSSYQTADVVRQMLNRTFVPTVYNSYYGSGTSDANHYAEDFIEAASASYVSPIHLASRILQEGNSNNRNGIYNFFNINADGENPQLQGLIWASGNNGYGTPWDSPKKSILGGADFLKSGYITCGQDTLYFQKYDVYDYNGSGKLYTHQYQQNITAPLTEGIKTYSTYNGTSNLDNPFLFIIPVYENMPNSPSPTPYGNPNHYLNNITVNNSSVADFNYQTMNYSISVSADTASVSVGATAIASGTTTISGTGTINTSNVTTNVPIVVTAENGTQSTYNLTINRAKSTVNTLKSLTIDKIDSSNLNFNKDTLTYNIYVDYNVTELNIAYETDDSRSSVSGPNQSNLSEGANKLEYVVTAESGVVKTYTINVIRRSSTGESQLSANNTLKSLSVVDHDLSFNKDKLNYSLEVEYSEKSVIVNYETEDANASVSGSTNTIQLLVGPNTINVSVTASNGEIKTYVITINRKEMNVEEVLKQTPIKFNANYLSGINIGTNVTSLTEKIKEVNINSIVTIKDKNGNLKTNSQFVTGDNVIITSGTDTKTYQTVIYGDIDGNGQINKLDYLAILRQYYGYTTYSGAYKAASDVNKDGKIDKLDYLTVLRDYYGYGKISQ